MNNIRPLLRVLLAALPFLVFLLLDIHANLKKPLRSRQILMPVIALIYCVVLLIWSAKLGERCVALLELIPRALTELSGRLAGLASGQLEGAADGLGQLADRLNDRLQSLDLRYLTMMAFNTIGLLVHVILKRIIITVLRGVCKTGNALYEKLAGVFYEHDEERDAWYIQKRYRDARSYLRCFFGAAAVISVLMMLLSVWLFRKGLLSAFFYPIYGIILIGECCFALGGLTKEEAEAALSAEEADSRAMVNYVLLRNALRKLFGDKLIAEDSSANDGMDQIPGIDSLLSEMEKSADAGTAAYALYMRKRSGAGFELDENYLTSGLELLKGKSILFNNPFYYDLIPYAFFAMNRTLLRHKKVLVILGRHGTERDLEAWCREGLYSISGIGDLWQIGELTDKEQALDVGIISRSSVHDEAVHEANREFLQSVEYVVLIEPSRLVTTAQVGLNNLIRCCRRGGKAITFCSTDKNCDGLIDALSHILMCSISEVSATNRHKGVCSYMCWTPDRDHLQHRMLPNLSRYLGVGTELSFSALKHQVASAKWYGGDAFPVVDMHWIVKQYYYDLLHYAGLPTSQETIDKCFMVSPNNWDERCQTSNYLTVEDEAFNMFEVKRSYSTRASEQSFINVLSSNYLLRDYMADNDSIFNADPKAIPYIVADYARTPRNVALRLCLKMSVGYLDEEELQRELLLIDADTSDPIGSLWSLLCETCSPIARQEESDTLCCICDGKALRFDQNVIRMQRKYSIRTGSMENQYTIQDAAFTRALLSDLKSARYIAEEEDAEGRYLGTELRGHIFQKYLPGQFFTFNGKYYEMVSVTNDGQVLVRRAADHINGRPSYRQVRRYVMSAAADEETMGACRSFGGLRIARQYADLRVEAGQYWELDDHNDFAGGRLVQISGIPSRDYCNKQILRIDFPGAEEQFTPEVRGTLALLINEIFRTLFAENQCYITAVTVDPAEAPLTATLAGEGGFVPEENAIYIIEDSQLDIGLLVAVERNIRRILSIAFDYLEWHLDALERSLNPPPPPEPFVPEATEAAEPEPKGFFRKIGRKLKEFFGKLFRKRGKPETDTDSETPEEQLSPREARKRKKAQKKAERQQAREAKKAERAKKKAGSDDTEADAVEAPQLPDSPEIPAEAEAPAAADLPTEPTEETPAEPDAESAEGEPRTPETGSAPEAFEAPELELEAEPEAAETEAPVSAGSEDNGGKTAGPDQDAAEFPALMSISGRFTLRSDDSPAPESDTVPGDAPEAEPENEPEAEPEDAPAPEPEAEPETPPEDKDQLEFEKEQLVATAHIPERKPYHLRYYLLYGGEELPAGVAPVETLEFLRLFGLENGELKQARDGKNIADLIEHTYTPNQSGKHYCDFCGVELSGVEYDTLADGRERCSACSRTAIRTAEEFRTLYKSVVQNLETFYGARITAPIKVEMVNSKRLHRRLGKTFVPTGKPDGRTLGVAIRDKNGYSILVENGAPRMASAMTMAHELTHIWQYLNWDGKAIRKKYGAKELQVYEGMAKWSEIQYAFLVGEPATGKREEMITRIRQDEYGFGFNEYVRKYPLSYGTRLEGETPFSDTENPL